jgi:hypothetical protein
LKGDFTRSTFDPRKYFLRVLMQQGQVQLDADWNEQAAILLHYMQTLAADIIGPHGGPSGEFEIREPSEAGASCGFVIQPGHYYVDGILCENEQPVCYTEQADYPDPSPDLSNEGRYLVYLDVWERHITCIQDDTICEVALGGPDTATRAKTVWQAKVWPPDATALENAPTDLVCDVINNEWNAWKNRFQPANRGLLKAQAKTTEDTELAVRRVRPPSNGRVTTGRSSFRSAIWRLIPIPPPSPWSIWGATVASVWMWATGLKLSMMHMCCRARPNRCSASPR